MRMIRLKLLRLRAGMTQEDLAARTGVPSAAISMIETERMTKPYSSYVRRLADGLGYKGSPDTLTDVVQTELRSVE